MVVQEGQLDVGVGGLGVGPVAKVAAFDQLNAEPAGLRVVAQADEDLRRLAPELDPGTGLAAELKFKKKFLYN